jgi:hypothetical protein
VRVGFTTLLTGAIGSFIANDPAPIRTQQSKVGTPAEASRFSEFKGLVKE